ncbi:WD repeat-containing protein 47 isoform X1 [Pararge aegeria]|uniref:WD repeat-containing protein 47 isoform X1 n=1 Tax=Pararge aegeria TaxID=116150 RepID=UPI0019CFBE6B|nr:WD repeat-containing protein 47 isoform X1 [Pararge aegeria]XP_039763106.1 WD repeat-containing protein 47 isoform X1 [Pararge aegeria]
MPLLQLNIGEEDVVRLILEFLHTRELHITQLSLERETGVINGNYADDVLFLRQLILDGQWDDVLEFIQPLGALKDFETNKFNYAILRHKYIELLCIKSEIKAYNNVENIVDEVVKVLSELEKIAPSKEEYSNLCLLLTLPSITDHAQFKKWNPSNARVQCFREVYPLVEQFLPCDKKPTTNGAAPKSAKNDRLMQLIIKGILYEACVNYCQSKATGTQEAKVNSVDFSEMLDIPGFDESDLSLLSWLQSIPFEIFSIPFEQRLLNVELERLVRPSLHTSWTEHMLVTPIKPRTFPHLAMPFRRPRSAADAMTRSLRPLPDGAPRHPAVMALSAIDYGPTTSYFAGFHLTGMKDSKLMNTSVDRLFDGQSDEFSKSVHQFSEKLKPIEEQTKTPGENSKSNETSSVGVSNATTPERKPRNFATSMPISKDGENAGGPSQADALQPSGEGDFRRELLKEYQIQKQRECDDYLRNLCSSEIRPQNQLDQTFHPGLDYAGPRADVSETFVDSTFNLREESFTEFQERANFENEVIISGSANLTIVKNSLNRASPTPVSVPPTATTTAPPVAEVNGSRPTFKPVTVLEDLQAVRCAEFHPNGKLYAVGSNTKNLRICTYPKLSDVKDDRRELSAPTVLLKRTKHHKGSIYCLAWSPAGDLLATGSNDKTVKLMRFNSHTCNLEGQEVELAMHDGTVRDVCFIEDTSNKASLLVSGGAGDCKIYVTDCATGKPFQSLTGHSGHVLSLYNWGGAMFVSGSQDKTVRFWDLRVGGCVNVISPPTGVPSRGSAVASLAVDPSGRLLVCGHDDGSCGLHDVRGSRALQRFSPHSSDVRSVRFSPGAYYLLTGGYDGRVMLTDMQGDLTCALPSVLVARHPDKVISARWHPEDFSFLSTSADKTAVLWTIPPV